MKSIAEHGKGRYLWASDPRALPQIFTNEVRQVIGKADPKKDESKPAADPPKKPIEPPPSVEVKKPDPKPEPDKRPKFLPFALVPRGLHESTQGIDFAKAPELRGMMPSKLKESALAPLVSSTEGRPVLAFWRYGLGKVAAWSTDFGSEFTREFVSWPQAPKLMAQVARAVSSNLRSSSLYNKIRLHQQGREVTISVDAPQVSAQLTHPTVQPLTVRSDGERPTIPLTLADPGQIYQVTISSGQERALIGLVSPTPPELQKLGINGQIFDREARSPGSLPMKEAPPASESQDLAAWLLIPALALLTLDLLIRRFRL
jgi:hypothetical protein